MRICVYFILLFLNIQCNQNSGNDDKVKDSNAQKKVELEKMVYRSSGNMKSFDINGAVGFRNLYLGDTIDKYDHSSWLREFAPCKQQNIFTLTKKFANFNFCGMEIYQISITIVDSLISEIKINLLREYKGPSVRSVQEYVPEVSGGREKIKLYYGDIKDIKDIKDKEKILFTSNIPYFLDTLYGNHTDLAKIPDYMNSGNFDEKATIFNIKNTDTYSKIWVNRCFWKGEHSRIIYHENEITTTEFEKRQFDIQYEYKLYKSYVQLIYSLISKENNQQECINEMKRNKESSRIEQIKRDF